MDDVLLRCDVHVRTDRGGLRVMPFEVRRGDVVRLDGPNGAGKTSLLRRLAGLGPHGQAPAPGDGGLVPRRRLLQQDPFDDLVGLTVPGEARLHGEPLPPQLAAFRHRASTTLSHGEARRVGLHLARHPVLLLDEPLEGLDAEGRALVRERIAQTTRAGGAVVLVDPTGLAADLVTQVVALAPPHALESLQAMPDPGGGAVLHTTRRVVTRPDGTRLGLPAIRLGAGLHTLEGPNGCGKSTWLLATAGLLEHALEGESPQVRGAALRIGENARILLARASDQMHASTVAEQCEASGVEPGIQALLRADLLARHPLSLSGGETQQVALALTLGRPASVYLLDEPEAHLDAAGWALLDRLVRRRIHEGSCIVAATHDERLARIATSRVPWRLP